MEKDFSVDIFTKFNIPIVPKQDENLENTNILRKLLSPFNYIKQLEKI